MYKKSGNHQALHAMWTGYETQKEAHFIMLAEARKFTYTEDDINKIKDDHKKELD